MALPLAVAAPLAIKGAGAIAQLIGASTMNPKRPEYNNPSLNEMVRLSEQQMNASTSPEMAMGKQMIDANTASASHRLQNSASSSGDILNGVSAIAQGGNRSLSDMIRHNMALKNQRRSQHLGVLSQAAQDDRLKFQINKQAPFDSASQTQSALYSAGIQGLSNGLSDYAAIAQMQAGQPKEKNIINLPAAPNRLGYMDMVNGGHSWENIIASLNR